MYRCSRTRLGIAAIAVVAGITGVAGCGGPDRVQGDTPAQLVAPSVAPGGSPGGPLTGQRREAIFLDATAAHLCSVQSRVYTDPGAMASAFASEPIYDSLTPAQVDELQQRLVGDPAFADRLTRRIQETCGGAR